MVETFTSDTLDGHSVTFICSLLVVVLRFMEC
jgi:hypothetical protein